VIEDERGLIQAVVARGDQRAFETLYDRHTPILYALALRLAGGREPEAQDLVHDTWVRAVVRLQSFEGRSLLRTWLCGILVRCWREVARNGARTAIAPVEELPLGADDDELLGVVDRVDLERAISSLADGYREILVLHDIEGYTHQEIAEFLGVEPGTSKSQLSRARVLLRRALDPMGERHGT
jgi:RNA polymerase sigma-70 factor (ECF subfamily)